MGEVSTTDPPPATSVLSTSVSGARWAAEEPTSNVCHVPHPITPSRSAVEGIARICMQISSAGTVHSVAHSRVVSSGSNNLGGWWDGARLAILVNGYEGKRGISDLLAHPGLEAARSCFDLDRHGCSADTLDACVHTKNIAHADRTDEVHGVHCDCHHTALRSLNPSDAACLVHLRHHPSTEDVAVGVRIGRHCDGAYRQIALWFGLVCHIFALL
jgi:hypothetical protein